jgi:hypothetical protein
MTPRRYWTQAEEAVLREHYANTHTAELAQQLGMEHARVLAKANAMGLFKSRAFIAAVARERSAAPGHASHAHRFAKGLVPWNKGVPFNPGGASVATRFKPGNKPHTWVPVGSFRVTKDNGLEQKFSDEPGPSKMRWRSYAQLVWEREHGPVQAGQLVTFKPGCKTTEPDKITPDVLELCTRADMMRRNSSQNYGPELFKLVQLQGVLSRQINKRNKDAQA